MHRTESDLNPNATVVAIAGEDLTLSGLTRFFTAEPFRTGLPWIHIAGICLRPGATPPEPEQGLPEVYPDCETMFAAHPDIRFLFTVWDDPAYCDGLKHSVPSTTTVVPPDMTRLFRDMISSEDICHHCRTELKRTRSLFYTLFDEMDEDLLLLDTEGKVLNANRHALESSGLSPRDLHQRLCCDVGQGQLCPAIDGKETCPLQQVLSTGVKSESLHSFVDEDGRMRYYRLYAYPIAEGEAITHVIIMRRDITARTHMEKRVQQTETLASIGELATYIAHEIRNPLFAIGGFANSLMRTEGLPDEAREKASIILEESRRLDAILKATLNFTRPTQAKQAHFSLNDLIEETMRIMRLGFADKKVEYAFHPNKYIALVHADPELVKQCLINIVKNASEAMETGGSLTITTDMAGDMVFFQVRDTGPGIPEQIRDKIFSPFFSTKNKGTGLGLPLTRKILKDMGGRMTMESIPGQGCRFTVYLPPVLAVAEDTDQNGSPPL